MKPYRTYLAPVDVAITRGPSIVPPPRRYPSLSDDSMPWLPRGIWPGRLFTVRAVALGLIIAIMVALAIYA